MRRIEVPHKYKINSDAKWAFWIRDMLSDAGITRREFVLTAPGSANQNRKSAQTLRRFLGGYQEPREVTAFDYGERFGAILPHISGITGLYAAGYCAELILFLNRVIPTIGATAAALILACLPFEVDHYLPYSKAKDTDRAVARFISNKIFSLHQSHLTSAWEELNKDATMFSSRSRNSRSSALEKFCRIAVSLERGHYRDDVRDACFPGVLGLLREEDSQFEIPESIFRAYHRHQGKKLKSALIDRTAVKKLIASIQAGEGRKVGA